MPRHKNLIIVACHAVYTGRSFEKPLEDSNWSLLPFQHGEPLFYMQHIRSAITLAAADPQALLIFSGGQTRQEAGPISEAFSYWRLAEYERWWSKEDIRERSLTEEYARDSFENLLFGICRFREYTGRYPDQVSMVSWGFKEERFNLHRAAIGFPEERFHYVGANNPVDIEAAQQGEEKALAMFRDDPFGRDPDKSYIYQKRVERDPFKRQIPYSISCPEIKPLLVCRVTPEAQTLPW